MQDTRHHPECQKICCSRTGCTLLQVPPLRGGYCHRSGESTGYSKLPNPCHHPHQCQVIHVGLVNQLEEFSLDISATALPLCLLLSPKRPFTCTPDHDRSFKQVREALARPPILATFDPAHGRLTPIRCGLHPPAEPQQKQVPPGPLWLAISDRC